MDLSQQFYFADHGWQPCFDGIFFRETEQQCKADFSYSFRPEVRYLIWGQVVKRSNDLSLTMGHDVSQSNMIRCLKQFMKIIKI